MDAPALSPEAFKAAKVRSDKAWNARSPWNALYQDAYDYVVPQRRPTLMGQKGRIEKLYDMTAPMAAMYCAGNLQRELFPPGQEAFIAECGPMTELAVRAQFGEDGLKKFNRAIDQSTRVMHPFFLTGEWDTSVHETCVDLVIGTGALLPVKGDSTNDPLRFAALPFDEIAVWVDAFGKVVGVSWKQVLQRDQLYANWPEGRWPDDWKEKAKSNPSDEVTFYQVFYKDAEPGGGWHFIAYGENMGGEVVHERTRTQPIAVPRYYRVPGEAYGRGVALTAMPSIKTLNKAQELALKAAAIQMLGIWGYRAGGTFNPNTVRMGPGEFWPMQSTGGILGPDVQRMDPASGNLNASQLVIGNLQDQVKQAMFDTRLPEYQGTPRAASEITARLRQKAEIHVGAYGRLVSEIMPIIVPRCAEILNELGIMQVPMEMNQLLYAIRVRSPMMAALNADKLTAIANYIEMGDLIAGPEQRPVYADTDKIMDRVAKGFQIDPDLVPDDDRKKQIRADIAKQRQQQVEMEMAMQAAKTAPKAIADMASKQQEAA